MQVHVRTIVADDWTGVAELHRQHYWRPYCLLLNRRFYEWQFESLPRRRGGSDASLVAVDGSGTIRGYLGVVEMAATRQGRSLRGAHLITWLIDPAAQGVGLGMRMMRTMTERYDFLFGRSVTPAALTVYQKLGFRYFPRCLRWLAILDADAALELAINPTVATRRRLRARQGDYAAGSGAVLHQSPPTQVEAIEQYLSSAAIAFDRNQGFLTWRYAEHPYLTYQYLTIGDPAQAMAVLRVERVPGGPRSVLRVVDFLATPERAADLGRAVVAHGSAQGCAYLDAFGMSERFVAGLLAAGAFLDDEEPELRLPHRLQPIDPDVAPPGLLFFGSSRTEPIAPHLDKSSLYVAKGDGNLDWPTWTPQGGSIAPPVTGYRGD